MKSTTVRLENFQKSIGNMELDSYWHQWSNWKVSGELHVFFKKNSVGAYWFGMLCPAKNRAHVIYAHWNNLDLLCCLLICKKCNKYPWNELCISCFSPVLLKLYLIYCKDSWKWVPSCVLLKCALVYFGKLHF